MPNFEQEAKIQAWIFGLPIIMGALAIFMYHIGAGGVLGSIGCYGYWLFFKAKISEKRRVRVLVSWGSRKMTTQEAKDYYTGYALMILAVGLMIYLSRLFG